MGNAEYCKERYACDDEFRRRRLEACRRFYKRCREDPELLARMRERKRTAQLLRRARLKAEKAAGK